MTRREQAKRNYAIAENILKDLARLKRKCDERDYTDTDLIWDIADDLAWILKKIMKA